MGVWEDVWEEGCCTSCSCFNLLGRGRNEQSMGESGLSRKQRKGRAEEEKM